MYRFRVLSSLIVFAATIASALDTTAVRPTYESVRLDSLVAQASRINAQIPDRLKAYRARIETEMSLALIDSAGQERTGQLEQIASDVRWRAEDRYDQRVVGYRSQAVGPMFSLMSIFGGWTTPTLYGNRLQLGVTPAMSARIAREKIARDTTSLTIHPLSTLRDSYYTFEGGDTLGRWGTLDLAPASSSLRETLARPDGPPLFLDGTLSPLADAPAGLAAGMLDAAPIWLAQDGPLAVAIGRPGTSIDGLLQLFLR